MRLLFLFLLIAQASFSQMNSGDNSTRLIDSLMQGEWYLSQTKISDPNNYFKDSSQIVLNQGIDPKIEFSNDSLKLYADEANIIYGNGIRGFQYVVEENSSFASHSIFVSIGKKVNPQLLESFEVISCTEEELVLRSFQSINDAQNVIDFTIVSTYQRKGNL